ncbi:MAG: glycosyltransferase family 4 protein [Thermoplasmatota archaeon]
MEQTKICMISSEYPPKWGGVGVCAYYLSTWMAKRGHEVHVVTRKQGIGYNSSHDNISIHPVPWLRAPMLFTLSFGKNAVRWMKGSGIDFDLVHVHSNMALLRKEQYDRIDIPLVSTMHGTWKGERSTISLKDLTFSLSSVNDLAIQYIGPRMDRYEDLALERSNAVIVESLSECKDISGRGVKNRFDRMIRLPPGIDVDEFSPEKRDNGLCRKYGIPESDRLIVSVGRWAARKGIREVVSAFEMICRECKDVTMALVGWGPMEREINNRLKKGAFGKKVKVLRSLPFPEMQALVATADVAMLHSYWEGFGLTVGEALSSGTPIVCTSVGGAPEMVPEDCGRLVRVGDVKGQAEAVLELLSTENLDEMGLRGRDHIIRNFSWSHVAERTEELYRRVAQDPKNEKGDLKGFKRCPKG